MYTSSTTILVISTKSSTNGVETFSLFLTMSRISCKIYQLPHYCTTTTFDRYLKHLPYKKVGAKSWLLWLSSLRLNNLVNPHPLLRWAIFGLFYFCSFQAIIQYKNYSGIRTRSWDQARWPFHHHPIYFLHFSFQ